MTRSILPSLAERFSRLNTGLRNASQQCALTERRSVERRHQVSDFRRRECRLRVVTQAAGLGAYDLDCVTGDNYWSPELKAMAGLPVGRGEVPLEQVKQLLHPDDLDRVFGKLEASLNPNSDGRFDDEHRLVQPDGTVRWVKVHGQTFFGGKAPNRYPLGASGVVIDITERRQAETLLREQSEELRLALRVGNSGTFQWDARTHEHHWCNEMLALYGLNREEFGSRDEDWLACLLPPDRKGAMAAVESSLATGEYAATFRIRRRSDGEIRWMNGRGKVYFDAQGGAVRMVGINVDITEQKQAQLELEESRTRLEAILDSLSEGVIVFDLEGQVQGMNPAAREIMGYATPDNVQRRLPDFAAMFELRSLDGRQLPIDEWPLARVMRGEPLNDLELELHRKDTGSSRIISHNGRSVRQDGKVILGVLTLRDITGRKAAEAEIHSLNAELERRVQDRTAELRQANLALLESNLQLKQFAHATAHDLQTPLRSITGFTQLLQREVQSLGHAQVDAWAALVVDNTKRLQTLIQDLLSYTWLENAGRPFQEVNLRNLVDKVLISLAALIQEKGAWVTYGDLPTVQADPSQMAQVLQNLIENGIKYNDASPPQVTIACDHQKDRWICSVTDNGIGIDPKHHERIFEMFRRLHSYHEIPGSGIGLAVCRRVVERHGGHLWVSSQPGQGSTFYFSLPAQSGENKAVSQV